MVKEAVPAGFEPAAFPLTAGCTTVVLQDNPTLDRRLLILDGKRRQGLPS